MRNKINTKELLNEWRKVLNEGLYNQDPEILEEIFTKSSREKIKSFLAAGLVSISALTSPLSTASAKVPGVSKEKANGITTLVNVLEENPYGGSLFENESIKFLTSNKNTIENIVKKLNSKSIQEFNENEAKVFKQLVNKREDLRKTLEETIKEFDKEISNANLYDTSPDEFLRLYKFFVELVMLAAKVEGLDKKELEEIRRGGDRRIENLTKLIESINELPGE